MRFLRVVSASILSARRSLSAVSSSTELLAVLTSIPSLCRRSITSWLERPRSRASWKTLTFPIRLTSLGGLLGALHDGRFLGLGGLFGGGLRLFRLSGAVAGGQARGFLGVALVPADLGRRRRLAQGLGPPVEALDPGQVFVAHLEQVGQSGHAGVDEALDGLVGDAVALQAAQLVDHARHARHLGLDLLALLLFALDVDAPAHQLGGQADVLA